jgi:hypothetical protein
MEADDNIIHDYFIFDMDDIELYQIKKSLEKTLTHDQIHRVKDYMSDFIINFQNENFDNINFPYLKTSILPYIESFFIKLDNNSLQFYYIILLLGNRNLIYNHVQNYYFTIINKNNFGMTPGIISAITNEVRKSTEYQNFITMLAEWYTKIEIIIFYITVMNHIFPNIGLVFNESNFNVDNNYKFSIKSFAKKHILKLASYICKNCGVNSLQLDYKKIMFMMVTSFTYGLSIRTMFTGVRTCAVMVDFFYIGWIDFKFCSGKNCEQA